MPSSVKIVVAAVLFVSSWVSVCGQDLERNGHLIIIPEVPTGEHQVPLGKPGLFTCMAKVAVPERVEDLRWYFPNGDEVRPPLNRVEILPGDTPGSISLFFSSVQQEDLGTYRCSAKYSNNQIMETSFTLKTFVPITFENAPENQRAVKNQDYKVMCHVIADPQPNVDWKKDHVKINSTDHTIITPDGLFIKGVTESDEGMYTCRVRVILLGQVKERFIQLEVQELPKITSVPREVEAVETESVLIKCVGVGKPTPKIIWTHKGRVLDNRERHVVDNYDGTLRIEPVQKEDSGEYQCEARNDAGSATATVDMIIITKPEIFEFINMTQAVENTVILTCRARGSPAPDIAFIKDSVRHPFLNGPQEFDHRIFQANRKDLLKEETVGTLKITDILRTDDGIYNCIAKNSRIQSELNGHLTVEFPPTFVNTPMNETWSWDGQPANVSCLAEAIPNATITWYVVETPERPVIPGPNIRQIGFESLSTLEIIPTHRDMFRFYKCVATNKLGVAQHQVYLREARRPGIILQVFVHEKTATSITFRIVGPVDNGGLPIDAYVAQYKLDRDTWDRPMVRSWASDQEMFIIEDLEPLRTYGFRFAAHNPVGEGDWAQEKIEVMPKRSPPEPPIILTDSYPNPYPNRCELHWTVPQDNGEKIDYFEISYSAVSNYSTNNNPNNLNNIWSPYGSRHEEIKPLGEPRHTLQKLQPDTFYRIEIRAHNSIGFSNPSQIIIKTAPTPGGTNYDSRVSTEEAGMDLPVIIVLVFLVLLVTVILVDITCYKVNQTGIIYSLTHCKKKQRPDNGTKTAPQEKQPFVEKDVQLQETKMPLPPDTVVVEEDGGMKTNGNGTKAARITTDTSSAV